MLTLSIVEIFFAIRTQEHGDGVFRGSIKQHHLPSECRSGNSCRPNRMTCIMVAITKGSLAILPRFPPMNRGQPDQKRLRRKWREAASHLIDRKLRSQFQPMFLRCVMVETMPQIESLNLWQDQIALCGVQIPR